MHNYSYNIYEVVKTSIFTQILQSAYKVMQSAKKSCGPDPKQAWTSAIDRKGQPIHIRVG
ncbi:hypothetical protein J31TS3_39530 [Paenibacillus lactis]|nr:hypothetical protein J31TS3_39530 [Paenibacillus lactis]